MVLATADKAPVVKLDDKHYKLVDKMEALVKASPSLLEATSVTVKGPVKFEAGTTLKGSVLIVNGDPPSTALCCLMLTSAAIPCSSQAASCWKSVSLNRFGCARCRIIGAQGAASWSVSRHCNQPDRGRSPCWGISGYLAGRSKSSSST